MLGLFLYVPSRKLAGVEERKTQFLARKVQESDQRRVEERDAEEQAEHVGVLETQQGCAKPPPRRVTPVRDWGKAP